MQLFTTPNFELFCASIGYIPRKRKQKYSLPTTLFLSNVSQREKIPFLKSTALCLRSSCKTGLSRLTICSESQAKRKAMKSTIIMEEAQKVVASRHSHCNHICLCLFQDLVMCQQSIYYIIILLPEASPAIKLDCQTHWIFIMPNLEDDLHLASHRAPSISCCSAKMESKLVFFFQLRASCLYTHAAVPRLLTR